MDRIITTYSSLSEKWYSTLINMSKNDRVRRIWHSQAHWMQDGKTETSSSLLTGWCKCMIEQWLELITSEETYFRPKNDRKLWSVMSVDFLNINNKWKKIYHCRLMILEINSQRPTCACVYFMACRIAKCSKLVKMKSLSRCETLNIFRWIH